MWSQVLKLVPQSRSMAAVARDAVVGEAASGSGRGRRYKPSETV